jgi:MATE family multidrug resistance protein
MLFKNQLSTTHDSLLLLKLAMPLILTGLIQSAIVFFTTLFLAHLGQDILAASSLVSWLFGTIAVIAFGTLSSINVLVAHARGQNNQENIRHIARDGLILACLLSVPTVILLWCMPPIFLFLGQPQEIVNLAEAYLHALAWGIVPYFISLAFLEVIIGIGHTRVILYFTILSVALNILCSYLLIFGKYGFPELGISGAGWALTASDCLASIILLVFIFTHKEYKSYFSRIFYFDGNSYVLELLKIGLPMGLMYCIEIAFFFILVLLMGLLGSDIQAANQVALQYLGICTSMIFSFAQAITIRIAHLTGAKEIDRAEQTSRIGIAMTLGLATISSILYWFFPSFLISIDLNIKDPANLTIISYIEKFLSVTSIFQICESIRMGLFGSLRGLKDTKFALITSIICFWLIALPLGYYLSKDMQLGGIGYWWAMVLGALINSILLYWRFKYRIKHYYCLTGELSPVT